ncbi:Arabinanase/levansucrase/invertase [Ceratobasidium sp. AG-I]|nr:Arabinanase/levansucrase/invertase [Ceratobasidium sp. AG-I]
MKLWHYFALFSFYSLCTSAYTNPLKGSNGSDPFMVYSNGYYYLTTTTWSNVQITRATSMAGLKTAQPKVVWTDTTASRCCNMWAPEIHWIASSNSWYIYYTAGASGNYDSNRIHVLKGSSSDIWASSWSYAGRIAPPNRDLWALDASVLTHSSGSYLIWSGQENSEQCIYIAKMNSPTSVGNAVKISRPTNSWERVNAPVNEGPVALYHGGRTWIVFSASLCSGGAYTLGRMELTGSDPLNPSNWVKFGSPIFSTANGNYAPGHNGFFTAPSGNIFNVYHASPTSNVQCGGDRRTFVQAVNWNSDGTPNLGQPRPVSENLPEPA